MNCGCGVAELFRVTQSMGISAKVKGKIGIQTRSQRALNWVLLLLHLSMSVYLVPRSFPIPLGAPPSPSRWPFECNRNPLCLPMVEEYITWHKHECVCAWGDRAHQATKSSNGADET